MKSVDKTKLQNKKTANKRFFYINSIKLNQAMLSGVKEINRRNFCLMLYSIKRTDHRRAHEPLGLVGACCTSLPSAR